MYGILGQAPMFGATNISTFWLLLLWACVVVAQPPFLFVALTGKAHQKSNGNFKCV
jgi:hypothetical protein